MFSFHPHPFIAGLLVTILITGAGVTALHPATVGAQPANVCPTNPSPPDAADPSMVVEHPGAGDEITSPVTVSGKARTFEANVQIHILGADGEPIVEAHTTAAEGAPALAAFSEEVVFSMSEEEAGCIMVFEGSAMDGSPRNVVLVPVVLIPDSDAPTPPDTGNAGMADESSMDAPRMAAATIVGVVAALAAITGLRPIAIR